MNKKELLSPVGDFSSLKYAVFNGADAVYLAGKKYGARQYAQNFTNEELISAIKFCHLYGVKIYVTVNTIIYEDELSNALEYLKFLHLNGVDAVIVQDLGLIKLIHKALPNLEIHASTQLHNHNLEQIKLLKELGVKRVVLARELSLEEINNIAQDIEVEAFIHGALCISYSGECLFSSLLINRSGNRGVCAGVCRLPYSLEKNKQVIIKDKYLLSPKELNTSYNLDQLIDSSITSFKIEGRMKAKEYVGFITKYYRELIDNYLVKKEIKIDKETEKNLKTIYNREFTKGYILNEKTSNLLNITSSNHQGIPLGTVLKVTNKKIKIKLVEDLNQEDGIRFTKSNKGLIANYIYDEKGKLINHANKGSIIYLDNKINLINKDNVVKTISKKLNDEINKLSEKKILINCYFKIVKNTFYLQYSDGFNTVKNQANIVEKAFSSPTSMEKIIKQITKFGNTPFSLNEIKYDYDNLDIFINITSLNELRRNLLNKLITKRSDSKKDIVINDINLYKVVPIKKQKINLSVSVNNEKQLMYCLTKKIKRFYTTNYDLYLKYKEKVNIYYELPRVITHHQELNNEKLLINEYGSINKYSKNNKVISNYYLNVVNSWYCNYLLNKQIDLVTLSIELNNNHLQELLNYVPNDKIELVIYTRPIVMLIKGNLLKTYDKNYTLNATYKLIDRNKAKYPIKVDKDNTYLYFNKPINKINDLSFYQNIGIVNYRIELFDEDESATFKLLNEFFEKLC